jgi:hypothetical protein
MNSKVALVLVLVTVLSFGIGIGRISAEMFPSDAQLAREVEAATKLRDVVERQEWLQRMALDRAREQMDRAREQNRQRSKPPQ